MEKFFDIFMIVFCVVSFLSGIFLHGESNYQDIRRTNSLAKFLMMLGAAPVIIIILSSFGIGIWISVFSGMFALIAIFLCGCLFLFIRDTYFKNKEKKKKEREEREDV